MITVFKFKPAQYFGIVLIVIPYLIILYFNRLLLLSNVVCYKICFDFYILYYLSGANLLQTNRRDVYKTKPREVGGGKKIPIRATLEQIKSSTGIVLVQ